MGWPAMRSQEPTRVHYGTAEAYGLFFSQLFTLRRNSNSQEHPPPTFLTFLPEVVSPHRDIYWITGIRVPSILCPLYSSKDKHCIEYPTISSAFDHSLISFIRTNWSYFRLSVLPFARPNGQYHNSHYQSQAAECLRPLRKLHRLPKIQLTLPIWQGCVVDYHPPILLWRDCH